MNHLWHASDVIRMGDYGHDLEFGVFIEPAARSADQVVALSVLAEEAGYDLVSYNDHPYSPRALDALALMSFVAARTGRVRLAGQRRQAWGVLHT